MRSFRSPAQPLITIVLLLASFACSTGRPTHDLAPSVVEGSQVGVEVPVADETTMPPSDTSWRSPRGGWIENGQIDGDGYVLPLDIRRPRPPRALPGEPSRLRIEALRRLAVGQPTETRLGPDDGHTQNETSIDAAGSTVIAGWNNFTDDSLAMGVGRSTDYGASWSFELFDDQDTTSDPVVASAGNGRWFYGYLGAGGAFGSDFEVLVRRSLDDGVTWQAPVAVTANSTFDDKPYLDARGDQVLVAWADFSFSPAKIRAARSLDGGLSYGADTILADQSVGGNGASPVIDAAGNYYVFWRDSFQNFLWMSKSTDQGATWSQDASIAAMDPLPSTLPPGFRVVNLPVAAAQPSTNTLVVLWNDEAFGDGDILSVRSTDGGASWSQPIRVNDDVSGQAQFFPWLTFDDDGVAHAIWYDRRHDAAKIDAYYASSSDAGQTWGANQRLTATSFTPVLPHEGGAASFIGDYNAIAAADGRVYPFYQDAREGNQDVWVAVLDQGALFADGFEGGTTDAWSQVLGE